MHDQTRGVPSTLLLSHLARLGLITIDDAIGLQRNYAADPATRKPKIVKRSDRIRLARRQAALSQIALATKLNVKRSAIANWESGATNPNSRNLERLVGVLDVSYEWLATGRGEMHLRPGLNIPSAAMIELARNTSEQRLLKAWRDLPVRARAIMLDLVESYPYQQTQRPVAQAPIDHIPPAGNMPSATRPRDSLPPRPVDINTPTGLPSRR